MKIRLISAVIAATFVISTTNQVIAGETRNNFGSHEITRIENINLGTVAVKVWNLNYAPQNEALQEGKNITILKCETKNGCDFIVRGEYFEVCYSNTPKGFGARHVKGKNCQVPRQITESVINEEALRNQRLITNHSVSDEQALELIAAYLPDLVNENYKHLLN